MIPIIEPPVHGRSYRKRDGSWPIYHVIQVDDEVVSCVFRWPNGNTSVGTTTLKEMGWPNLGLNDEPDSSSHSVVGMAANLIVHRDADPVMFRYYGPIYVRALGRGIVLKDGDQYLEDVLHDGHYEAEIVFRRKS